MNAPYRRQLGYSPVYTAGQTAHYKSEHMRWRTGALLVPTEIRTEDLGSGLVKYFCKFPSVRSPVGYWETTIIKDGSPPGGGSSGLPCEPPYADEFYLIKTTVTYSGLFTQHEIYRPGGPFEANIQQPLEGNTLSTNFILVPSGTVLESVSTSSSGASTATFIEIGPVGSTVGGTADSTRDMLRFRKPDGSLIIPTVGGSPIYPSRRVEFHGGGPDGPAQIDNLQITLGALEFEFRNLNDDPLPPGCDLAANPEQDGAGCVLGSVSCNCPDKIKQSGPLAHSLYPSEHAFRDWRNSGAGARRYCKHIYSMLFALCDPPRDPNDRQPDQRRPQPNEEFEDYFDQEEDFIQDWLDRQIDRRREQREQRRQEQERIATDPTWEERIEQLQHDREFQRRLRRQLNEASGGNGNEFDDEVQDYLHGLEILAEREASQGNLGRQMRNTQGGV